MRMDDVEMMKCCYWVVFCCGCRGSWLVLLRMLKLMRRTNESSISFWLVGNNTLEWTHTSSQTIWLRSGPYEDNMRNSHRFIRLSVKGGQELIQLLFAIRGTNNNRSLLRSRAGIIVRRAVPMTEKRCVHWHHPLLLEQWSRLFLAYKYSSLICRTVQSTRVLEYILCR
jgi:hypothetical protein